MKTWQRDLALSVALVLFLLFGFYVLDGWVIQQEFRLLHMSVQQVKP